MKKFKFVALAFALTLFAIVPMLTGCTAVPEASISVVGDFKNEYYIGETLNTEGGILLYTDENGEETYVEITEDMVSAFTSSSFGEKQMIISYNDLTTLYSYSVCYQPTLAIKTNFAKLTYEKGEALDVSGANLKYVDKEGKENIIPVTVDMVTGFSTTTTGVREMTITYQGLSIDVEYTIMPEYVQFGVPYYVFISYDEDFSVYSVVIFNNNKTVSFWQSEIMPTLENSSELFKEGSENATCTGSAEFTEEIIEDKWVLKFNFVPESAEEGFEGVPTTITVLDKGTIKLSQQLDAELVYILTIVGHEE